MPRASVPAKPRKRAARARKAAAPHAGEAPSSAKVAVPAIRAAAPPKPPIDEPVWLVRSVIVLFLVGFAAFLAREVYNFVQALG